MEHLVDLFIKKIKAKDLYGKEYTEALIELCTQAGDIRESQKIKWDCRRRRKKIDEEKWRLEKIVKEIASGIEDLSANNKEFFDAIRDKYKYHYKHID